ncbi:TPA_asm: trp operon leader peptide [Salmonella enterica]|uniref:trp operon leader peptide n=1 Tax=Salmonella enterica TaxID=28901 RepID=A0A727B050_SALER|nr:trp operon leader peptide [Salmonella enterica subsp. enterica serovar Senftenberg]
MAATFALHGWWLTS